MADWVTLTEAALVFVVLLLLFPIAWLFARRRWLSSRGRVFDCALHQGSRGHGSGWMLGTARYLGDRLEWYRTYSLSIRPGVVLHRADVELGDSRAVTPREALDLFADSLVVELAGSHVGIQLAMDRAHLTAFRSWAEAGAPGGRFPG
ncbi:MAG: DUF2550 domain-containing protein [Propionibacteriaceae bacterium]|nr:DUF2550 domain-containing protein [Propionibacteriaceae bacterium]